MTDHRERPGLLACWVLAAVLLPHLAMADDSSGDRCGSTVLFTPTQEELQQTGFQPGGIKPFLLGILAGPRIALEWNDGRGIRTIEILRSLPYAGNLVGLYLCTEALSGYRMTSEAAETGIDDWSRDLYFKRIKTLETQGQFAEAARLRECSPFDTYNHPPNPAAIKPDERRGFAKWKSGLSGLLIDNRVGLEREESRGIRTIEYWTILRIPLIVPAIEAYRGKKMSEVVRKDHLDEVWLDTKSASAGDASHRARDGGGQ